MAKDPIKKAKNGMYYFRANLGYDGNGKKIQKYQSGFKTKKEAKEEYFKLLLMKPDELAMVEDKMLFKAYIEELFLPWYRTKVKERTYNNRLNTVLKHFPYFYKLAVCDIEPIHVQKWQLKLSKNLQPSYVRAVQGLFSLAMDRAVVLGLAVTNPSKIVGNVKKQKQKVDFWTKEEFEKVISLIYKDDFYQHFLFISLWFLFMTGMRIGEATAIQWEDLDFETGVLSITKTLYYKNQSEYYFTEPKTQARQVCVLAKQLLFNGKTLILKQVFYLLLRRSIIRTNQNTILLSLRRKRV